MYNKFDLSNLFLQQQYFCITNTSYELELSYMRRVELH
jgi:hypothetical protein